jgi:hypothetical protein
MDGIGSIGMLAAYAAQPFAAARAAPAVTEASGTAAGAAGSGAVPSDFEAQYQMSVLSKVMYAGADQALALIQMLPKPASPVR